MYAALWRSIPGGLVNKITAMTLLVIGAVALLFYVVFPVADSHLPWNNVNVRIPPRSGVVSGPSGAVSPSALSSVVSPSALPGQ